VIGHMIAAGGRTLARTWRLVGVLHAIQAALALGFGAAARVALSRFDGDGQLVDRAMAGDLEAALLILAEPGPLASLVVAGLVIAAAYLVVSWYIGAGLLGAIEGDGFTDSAARGFAGFARLWLVSLVPFAAAVAAIVWAGRLALPALLEAVRPADLAPLAAAAPGFLMLCVSACAVDYARIELLDRGGSAAAAYWRGLRRVVSSPAPLLHYAAYLTTWVALTALHLTIAPALGLVATLIGHQILALCRFAARVAAYGGQVARVRAASRVTTTPLLATPILRRALP
jgi:hypothetical protein